MNAKGSLQQATMLKIFKKANTLPIIRKTRHQITVSDSDDDNLSQQEGENADDLLNAYANVKGPPLKKFKDRVEIDDRQSEAKSDHTTGNVFSPEKISPNRNPFKKKMTVSEPLLSPTEITKLNRSLLQNLSPVKQIDYTKLEKLSKFSRTVVTSRDQNVISRFFCSATTVAEQNSKIKTENSNANGMATKTEREAETEKLENEKNDLYVDASSISTVSGGADKTPKLSNSFQEIENELENVSIEDSTDTDHSQKIPHSGTTLNDVMTDDDQSDELPIEISEDDDTAEDAAANVRNKTAMTANKIDDKV